MTRAVCCVTFLLFSTLSLIAPFSDAAEPSFPSGAAAEVATLIRQWADARVKGDAAFLESFYARDLRIGGANGVLVDRDDDIALFAARRIVPEFIRDTEVAVTVYGETAVVTCIETLRGTYNGQPGDMSLRMLNVLARRDGRWQLVASQSAIIPRPMPGA